MEGTFYFPLPPDASLSRLAMYVSHGEESTLMEGGMAEREHRPPDLRKDSLCSPRSCASGMGRRESIQDARLPLEGRQEKRIILSYSQKLPVSYGRTSYRFPAGHSLNHVRDWSFSAIVKGGTMMTATSPSHPDMKIQPQGTDLVLTDKKSNIRADKDVLVDLYESNPNATPSIRWSSTEQDGHKYLMLHYRPQLPGLIRRERRDWVILFEASGARDPLVARAQIEILRNLLNNAEHDDTFALMTVGTRIHKFAPQPMPVSPDNLAAGMKFLEQTQLIGALNLEGALKEAQSWLAMGQNPHLVHIGGGVATLGEHRTDRLIPMLPAGTRYVGVGVGKRVSPAFMKVAAEKTGGLFTQINPDEPIAWRGFELASTLNTPRLLNITVSAGEKMPHFLTFTNTLAHGEELAAVARIDDAALSGVVVNGSVDGQTFERTVPIQEIAAKADYLPRTWAKLEIDQLIAEDIRGHQQTITELSKAMYVMTPFTSLLVLENEAMYKEFNIDRGRKDHWAMYGCPAKMPTVYIPDPNQPAGLGIQRINQKPHANEVLQTILCRTMPRYLNWPNNNNQNDSPVLTAGQLYGGAFAVPESEPLQLSKNRYLGRRFKGSRRLKEAEDLTNEEIGLDPDLQAAVEVDREDRVIVDARVVDGEPSGLPSQDSDVSSVTQQMGSLIGDLGDNRQIVGGTSRFHFGRPDVRFTSQFNVNGTGTGVEWSDLMDRGGGLGGQGLSRRAGNHFWAESDVRFSPDGVRLSSDWGDNPPVMMMDGSVRSVAQGLPISARLWDGYALAGNGTNAFANLSGDRFNTWNVGINVQVPLGFRSSSTAETNDWRSFGTPSVNAPLPIGPSRPGDSGFYGAAEFLFMQEQSAGRYVHGNTTSWNYFDQNGAPHISVLEEKDAKPDPKEREELSKALGELSRLKTRRKVSGILQGINSAPTYYGRPSFSGLERVFTDLVAYAPGMTSLPADIQAVLEAEAAPRSGQRRGTVTPAAKLLIDRARTSNWHITRFGKNDAFAITHDGQGRFAYERKLPFGLKEQVVCDGSTLLHLYPELGIGATRVVSRFHRAELAAILTDVLPPSEDLTVGADVVAVDNQTAAIVPLEVIQPGEEDLPQAWVEVHLVFEGNRLAERRTVLLLDEQITKAIAAPAKKEAAKKAEAVPLSPRARKHRATGALLVAKSTVLTARSR